MSRRDLRRGQATRTIDVLRLAMQHILKHGWAAPGVIALLPRASKLSIEKAIELARRDLQAPWMRGVEASETLRGVMGANRYSTAAIPRFEREDGRTDEQVRELFRAAILSKMETETPTPAGALLDVTA